MLTFTSFSSKISEIDALFGYFENCYDERYDADFYLCDLYCVKNCYYRDPYCSVDDESVLIDNDHLLRYVCFVQIK